MDRKDKWFTNLKVLASLSLILTVQSNKSNKSKSQLVILLYDPIVYCVSVSNIF